MADFNTTGFEGLSLGLEELADLPENVLQDMLEAKGEVVRTAQVQKIKEMGLVESHQLEESITVNKKMRVNRDYDGMQRFITVYPAGIRRNRDGTDQTAIYKFKKRRRGKTESVRAVSNTDVAFIAEFGAPRKGLVPKQWMRLANEEAADDAAQAAMRVYEEWLDTLDL